MGLQARRRLPTAEVPSGKEGPPRLRVPVEMCAARINAPELRARGLTDGDRSQALVSGGRGETAGLAECSRATPARSRRQPQRVGNTATLPPNLRLARQSQRLASTQALDAYLCHDARSRGPARAPLGGLRGRLRAEESDAASESAARAAGGPVHGGRRAPRRHPLAAADQPVAAGPGAVAARLHGAAALPPRQRRARPRRFDAFERRARGLAKPLSDAGTRPAARRCSTSSSRGIGRCIPTSS